MLTVFRVVGLLLPFVREVFFQSSNESKFWWSRTILIGMLAAGFATMIYLDLTERIDFFEKENLSQRNRIADLEHANILLDGKYTSLEIAYRERGVTIASLNKTNEKLLADLEQERAHHHATTARTDPASVIVTQPSSLYPPAKPKPKITSKVSVKPVPKPKVPAVIPRPPPASSGRKNRLAEIQ